VVGVLHIKRQVPGSSPSCALLFFWSIWRARAEQAGGADGLLGLRPGDLALRGPHGWGRGWATRPRDLALGWLSDVAFGVTINM
jgi:hypothetical protein